MYFQHVANVSLGNIPLIVSLIDKLIHLSQHSNSAEINISMFFTFCC